MTPNRETHQNALPKPKMAHKMNSTTPIEETPEKNATDVNLSSLVPTNNAAPNPNRE
jgi:hypothetical protein